VVLFLRGLDGCVCCDGVDLRCWVLVEMLAVVGVLCGVGGVWVVWVVWGCVGVGALCVWDVCEVGVLAGVVVCVG